ncbi:hypothetical protein AAW12_22820 [Sphingobacterium sp. Ag1]|uniref:hypothetical protein n=1 Tax=Sphingobacterium sp. Ag1 TaxID=1643451 RepID=UPI0006278264|nr:hypothetical protein [Sphingobacterium sp. Ag1]KKO89002.1 hypothetical protein AAW12_22820 [Sphingobacterium sp. Ag1]
MKKYSIAIGLSTVLCLIAFFVRDQFLTFFTTEIIGESPLFKDSWRLPGQVLPTLIFIFSLWILPFLYLSVKNYCKLSSVRNQLLAILLICTSGSIFCGMRVIYLKFKVAQIHDLLRRAEFASDSDIPSIRFQDMHLESYLLVGLIAGWLLCMIIFRKSTNPKL